jgi:uncharacterized protein (DUF433 family)
VAAFYSLADCARLLRKPRETIREWTVKGLVPARPPGQRASPSYGFPDLISLHVVAELRARGVSLQRIRRAEEWLRYEGGFPRPFATQRLYSAGKEILIRPTLDGEDDSLLVASQGGQHAIEDAFEAILQTVDYDDECAIRWRPWADVELSPRRQFGAPCLAGTGIQTSMVAALVRAGDDPAYLAQIYSRPADAVAHAVSWEESLAAA